MPTIAPPNSCVLRPTSVAARTIPTESGGYDASRTTSGLVARMARTTGVKSTVEGG